MAWSLEPPTKWSASDIAFSASSGVSVSRGQMAANARAAVWVRREGKRNRPGIGAPSLAGGIGVLGEASNPPSGSSKSESALLTGLLIEVLWLQLAGKTRAMQGELCRWERRIDNDVRRRSLTTDLSTESVSGNTDRDIRICPRAQNLPNRHTQEISPRSFVDGRKCCKCSRRLPH